MPNEEQRQRRFVRRTKDFDLLRNQSIKSLDHRLVDVFETWSKKYA
jgi:hypothetical protein